MTRADAPPLPPASALAASRPFLPLKPGRLPGVDAGRVIAALATVWLHTVANPLTTAAVEQSDLARTTVFGRFAVPFFGFVAGLFIISGLRSRPNRPISGYFSERVLRLYMPFLGWTAIFLAVRASKQVLEGRPIDPELLGPGLLLAGSAQHLWFLPFLLLAGTIAFAVGKVTVGNRRSELFVGAIIAAFGLALAFWPTPESFVRVEEEGRLGLEYFFSRCFIRAPAFLWGVAFGLMYPGKVNTLRVNWPLALLGLACTALCLAGIWVWDRNSALENLAGLCWVVCALGPWRGAIVEFFARLGNVSYGVYLSHPLFTLGLPIIFIMVLRKVGVTITAAHPWWFDIFVFLAASVASIVLILLLQRSKYTRWLAP
jgi:surface polysaccharide O-acyltransferase-like enzyme